MRNEYMKFDSSLDVRWRHNCVTFLVGVHFVSIERTNKVQNSNILSNDETFAFSEHKKSEELNL